MAPSPYSLAAFAIAGAIALVALALALSRLRGRRAVASPDPTGSGALRAPALFAVIAAAAAGLAAMGLAFYIFLGGAASSATPAGDGLVANASRAELVRHLERSPDDGRAWVLLARTDFAAERYAEAADAYQRALAASPKVAADPGVWCEYADALGMAQGGSLAGRPRELVMRALAQNPAHPKALEIAGSAAFEAGEYAAAVQFWRQLLPQLANDPRAQQELNVAIARAELMTTGTGAQSGAPAAGR